MNKFFLLGLSVVMALLSLPAGAALSDFEQAPVSKSKYPRVGDTLESLTAQFGAGKKNTGKIRLPGKDEYYWEMKGFGINVVIEDDKAVMLVIHRVGRVISEAEIKDLLAANTEGRGWRPDSKIPRWISNDNQLEAFREKDHKDMFFIQDIAAITKSGHGAHPGGR